jgi:hypothetical protein
VAVVEENSFKGECEQKAPAKFAGLFLFYLPGIDKPYRQIH